MPTVFWLWLAAAVIFLIIEIGTPTLVFACFVIGAVGGAVSSTMTESYLIQAAGSLFRCPDQRMFDITLELTGATWPRPVEGFAGLLR